VTPYSIGLTFNGIYKTIKEVSLIQHKKCVYDHIRTDTHENAKHRDLYESNSETHNINTRSSSDLHTTMANLTSFQKGSFYFGIKVFNLLPTSTKKFIS
jgi:hypothetical protein